MAFISIKKKDSGHGEHADVTPTLYYSNIIGQVSFNQKSHFNITSDLVTPLGVTVE